ncbi:putative UbiE/COQ5 family methyltransferase [Pseudomassariella vexata]|uniref:Putative UbiE/COQ5 family methyltransferase n=1 Tax=Pseudomassariella vexata TaxID=1141098 RepID=A0A1Y2D8Y6_9PEZI|nr:putative UbiE/COQ5 family methyltransferase [Pseudomassariella vexata]ORY55105.1 putative UbiE/COQ5 family methyltransferase [Pseudomassariella vexata]
MATMTTLPSGGSTLNIKSRIGMPEFFGTSEASNIYSSAEHLTGPVATPLLEHAGLNQDIKTPIEVLDLACGTGVVSAHLHQILKEHNTQELVKLTCADLSDSQIAHVRRRMQENGWPNTEAVVVDASQSSLPSDNYDVVIIGMALMLIPDSRGAVKECYRMLKPNGCFAVSLWHIEGWIYDVRDALSNLPGSPPWPQDSDELISAWAMGPWHNVRFVKATFQAAGFFCYIFRAFMRCVTDDYWTPEQRAQCMPLIEPALKDFFNKKYGLGQPFTVERTAIMASGRKPAK